jgi:hypothetical protein
MRTAWSAATVLFLVAAGVARPEEDKKKSPTLPKAVASVVKDTFPKAKVADVEREEEDGQTIYEVKLKYKHGTLEVLLSRKGQILKVDLKGEDDDKGKKNSKKGEDDDKGKKNSKKGEDDDKGKKNSKKGEDDDKGKKNSRKGEDDQTGEHKGKTGRDHDKGNNKARTGEDDDKGKKKAKKDDD